MLKIGNLYLVLTQGGEPPYLTIPKSRVGRQSTKLREEAVFNDHLADIGVCQVLKLSLSPEVGAVFHGAFSHPEQVSGVRPIAGMSRRRCCWCKTNTRSASSKPKSN